MNTNAPAEWLENITYDELTVGQSARLLRTLTLADIQAFAAVSGDTNPAHLNADYANDTLFHGVIAHGMWGGALISALLGTQFPGPGTIYLEQQLHFTKPVRIGDTLAVMATVVSKDDAKKRVELDCLVTNQKGDRVLHGTARVLAPTQKVRLPKPNLPQCSCSTPKPATASCWPWARALRPPAAPWCILATSSRSAAPWTRPAPA
jgi:phosphate acetyltransferase